MVLQFQIFFVPVRRQLESNPTISAQRCLTKMRRSKCADTSGLVAECFTYGNLDLHKCPLDVFNHMLTVGRFDESWSHTVFTMLPKGGNLLSPNNWRPVAVFAQLVYKRLRPRHQSKDQVGFRMIQTQHKCRRCLCSIRKCLQQVFGMEFPCLVCKLRFEESVRPR